MRVEYIGKSVANLGVIVPNRPPIQCGFSYGDRFRKDAPDNPFPDEPNVVGINPDKDDNADILVLNPSEFDEDPDEIIVVVVNERCLQNTRLLQWFKDTLGRDPDGPATALVFVPEKQPSKKGPAHVLRKALKREGVDTATIPYYPKLI